MVVVFNLTRVSFLFFFDSSAGTHTEADPIAAVMGIDVTLQYLYKLLVDTLPVCLEKNIRYCTDQDSVS